MLGATGRVRQKAYAAAVTLAPDLPAGYYSWGVALARHGDLAGAEAKLKAANQRGPHWADPLGRACGRRAWSTSPVGSGECSLEQIRRGAEVRCRAGSSTLKLARDAAAKQKR